MTYCLYILDVGSLIIHRFKGGIVPKCHPNYHGVLPTPLPFQIQALSQILIFTSISKDVYARVKAFHLG